MIFDTNLFDANCHIIKVDIFNDLYFIYCKYHFRKWK
jgi:hypothetical protein